MSPSKIINLNELFTEIGGAEKVALELHKLLKRKYDNCYLMADNPLSANNPLYHISPSEYIPFGFWSVLKAKNSVIISHHRKYTTLVYLLNKFFRLNIKIIHVMHNEFSTLKRFTLLPKNSIAVSNRVKENMVSYFGLDKNDISVIYNGVRDYYDPEKARDYSSVTNDADIKILYGARITEVKGQSRLVKNLKGKIPANIKIDFVGSGEPELEKELQELVKDDPNFNYIGYSNLSELYQAYDYFMLFSSKEGLPLTIIEACSCKLPIICSDVGGNSEIVENNINGYVINDYDKLINFFNNNIAHPGSAAHAQMAANSRRIYENTFRDEQMLDAFSKYIDKVIAG